MVQEDASVHLFSSLQLNNIVIDTITIHCISVYLLQQELFEKSSKEKFRSIVHKSWFLIIYSLTVSWLNWIKWGTVSKLLLKTCIWFVRD